ncbi:MAG: hypothetical protein EG823_08595 [Actinobacteria bacterium]|nr:hypothetical protein [Actinomycetota bacterium]
MDRLPLAGAPFAFGLTFVPPAAYAHEDEEPAAALARVCGELGAAFAFVPSDEAWTSDAVSDLEAIGVGAFLTVSGPFWPVIEARGLAQGLRETLTRPDETRHALEDGLGDVLTQLERGMGADTRAVVLAEDLAGSAGPLVAPDFAITQLLPLYAEITALLGTLGLPAVFHSDGDIRLMLPAIRRAGFAGVHCGGGLDFDGFERLFWAAREADLAVLGGLLTAELVNATRAEALGSRLGVLAKAGGLFVTDDGGITTAQEMTHLAMALAAARDT